MFQIQYSMKKILQLIRPFRETRNIVALCLAFFLCAGSLWAQTTITWSAADQGYENSQVIESVDFDDNVTGTFDKGTNNNAPKYYTTGAAIRCYGGNYFTISTAVGNLTEIVISFASGEGTNAITTDVGTYADGTWSGEAQSVTFTIGGSSGHRRLASFEITYATTAPSVAIPTFSPASGTEFGDEGLSVTISCETQGASIYYTLNGSNPTSSSMLYDSSNKPIITSTCTVKAIAIRSGWTNSAVASQSVTVAKANVRYGYTEDITIDLEGIYNLSNYVDKVSPLGEYSTSTINAAYLWFCIPSNQSFTSIKSSGYSVPMENPVTIGGFKCYRSSNKHAAGTVITFNVE